ncbi:IST1 homolog isoform X2 [Actinia tenebrosa]|uniref:IST1 homolog n=1 Tax=Actinia tenebrosa TaxID=6105 RepID=A0A6P8HUU2_ACTTE|nr:IST1 homolog isoform X2 [Actinia tenebrosa]
MGFNKQKLKTNLKLAINRLKLLEKKKTELAQKARKEIAEYIANGKEERARIRVEHIIREDYLVEALEVLELYCDLLLARFGLIETMSYCDEGMIEAVTSLIWVAPRLQTDVQEFRTVAEQLGYKYGKKFAHEASTNCNATVNERLIQKLSPKPPPKILVERYLIEIARSHSVPFEPDLSVMASEEMLDLDDLKGGRPGGNSGGGGDGGHGIGFENFNPGPPPGNPLDNLPNIPAMAGGNPGYAYPPPQSGTGITPYPPPDKGPSPGGNYPMDKKFSPYPPDPGFPSDPRKSIGPSNPAPSAPPAAPSFPDLPSVPTNSLPTNSVPGENSAGGEDVDFDDLNRRFEELKKRK